MSPQVYKNAVACMPNHGVDLCKADVFSAGLTILEAANLRRVRRIYGGPGCKELIVEKLTQEILILKNRYPENNLLYSTVRKMLDVNPNKRPTFLEILEKLPDYKLIKTHFIENGDSLPVEVDVRNLFNLSSVPNSRMSRPISRSRNQSSNSLVPQNYGGFVENSHQVSNRGGQRNSISGMNSSKQTPQRSRSMGTTSPYQKGRGLKLNNIQQSTQHYQ